MSSESDAYAGESAEDLLGRLASGGAWPEPELLEAIHAKGADAVPPLLALLEEAERAGGPAPSDEDVQGRFYNVVDLLCASRDSRAIPAIAGVLERYPDDDITEFLQDILPGFGAPVADALLPIVRNRALEWYPRAMAVDVALDVTENDPERRGRVIETMRALLKEYVAEAQAGRPPQERAGADDRDMVVGDLIGGLAEVQDTVSRPDIDAAFEANIVDLDMIDPPDVDRLFAGGRNVREYDPNAWIRIYRRQYAEHQNPKPPAAGPPFGWTARTASSAIAPYEKPKPFVHTTPKLGRNDPCWCGSGKKYKKCHMLLE